MRSACSRRSPPKARRFCLKVLGKDDTPAATVPMPDSIRRLMRLGTLYRFEAIVDGMPRFQPVDRSGATRSPRSRRALNASGLNFDEVRTGAFLRQGRASAAGKPCLMIEKLYRRDRAA